MEPDGILNGSNKKDLNNRTIRIIGKNDRAYSTMIGSLSFSSLRGFHKRMSASHINPVTTDARNKIVGKSKFIELPQVHNLDLFFIAHF
jgi:hypothetical protein